VPFATASAQQEVAQPVEQSPADDKQGSSAQAPVPEEMPVTVRPNGSDVKKAPDTDPVMGVPALPAGKTSLIGGEMSKLDGVHNKLGVSIFGGGQWEMAFDERTHFYRDGVETTFGNIKKGDRVYVDTMLDSDGHRILARSVRVVTQTGPPDARGKVIAV